MKTTSSILFRISGLICLCLLLSSFKAKSQIRITKVDPFTEQVTIHNFNSTGMTNIATYWFCTKRNYAPLNTATIISGSLALNAGADVVIVVNTAVQLDNVSSDLSIYLNSAFSNPANMVDFMKYGNSFPGTAGREDEAVAQGLWAAGTFILGDPAPWSYIGDGNQNGVNFWTSSTLSLENEQLRASLLIFPIPVSSTLTIKKLATVDLKALSIYDSRGLKIYSEALDGLNSDKNISLENFAKGIYFIRISDSKGGLISKKILKI